jgi:hypothetical protein
MYAQRRRNHFSLAAPLEPLQSVDGATELSLDRSFIAKDLGERFTVRYYVLCDCDFVDCGSSRLSEFFEKT